MSDTIYSDESERDRAIRYSRTREWLLVAGTIWSVVETLFALWTGLSARMRTLSEERVPGMWSVLPFAAAGTILSYIASLPLSFYSDHVIEQRYGLSNQTAGGWFRDGLKGLGVGTLLGAPLIASVYWAIRRWPARWWAILSGLTVPFSIIMVNLAPVLIMPLFNRFEPIKKRALAERIKRLAAGEGVHVSDVMQMDMSKQTKKANAFFTGLGNSKRIVLGDTLLNEFTDDEVEVVLAHELGHQVHRDLWKLIALSAPTSLISLYSAHRLAPPLLRRFGSRWGIDPERGIQDPASLPLLALIGQVTGLVMMPIFNAISRTLVEHPADRYALDLTGNNGAFITAMEKLGRMNLTNPQPSALIKYLLYSHPPVAERIRFGRTYTRKR